MRSALHLFFSFAAILIFSTKIMAQDDPARFLSSQSTTSLTGSLAVWQNPAGLAFLTGQESGLLYQHHWGKLANRHHGGLNLASNFFDAWSLGGGVGFQASTREQPTRPPQSTLSGIFGTAVKLSASTALGISFLKSHDFSSKRSSDTQVSFGIQARPAPFLALGAHFQEVFDGHFSAAQMTGGIAVRPFHDVITVAIDGRLKPKSPQWSDGYRLDPILNLTASHQGLGASVGAEFPGRPGGFSQPLLTFGIKVDFAHTGFSFDGSLQPSTADYSVGGKVRASSAEWEAIKKPHGLYVRLNISSDGTLSVERPTLAQQWLGGSESPLATLALLRRIAQDDSIVGVIINLEGFSFGDASAYEWREEVLNLKRHNKEVVVYLDGPSAHDYYIASAADKIFMNNRTTLSFRRFQATLTHFANMLKKIGVTAEATVSGAYKTAPRTWTHAEPSKEELEVYSNILNTFYKTMISATALARNLEEETVKSLFDQGELTASEAKDAGLIDDMLFEDEINPRLEKEKGRGLRTYYHYQNRRFHRESWAVPNKIVVIPVVGEIVDGRVYPSILPIYGLATGARDVEDEIASAVDDPNVAGIIIRINSPGGSSESSHRINRALIKARETKPVVASMGDVAASGGFLAAAGADHILALPTTITGSIGVYSLNFSGEELAHKIGVTTTELSPIKNPGPTLFRSMSPSEKSQAQAMVNWHYQNFLTAVALGLNLEKDEVQKQAEGRVWLGQEAFEKKLVSELGGFAQALDSIRILAEIPPSDDVAIEIRSPGQTSNFALSSRVISLFGGKNLAAELKNLGPLTKPYFNAINAYRLHGMPLAKLPFEIEW